MRSITKRNVRMWWGRGTREAVRRRAAPRHGMPCGSGESLDANVILGGMVYLDVDWIEAVCEGGRSGRRVDVIPFHAYPETLDAGERNRRELPRRTNPASGFVSSADAACGRKRMWINETGYATFPGRTEEDQARCVNSCGRDLSCTAAHRTILESTRSKTSCSNCEVIGDVPNYHLRHHLHGPAKISLAFTTFQPFVSMLGHTTDRDESMCGNIISSPSAADVVPHPLPGRRRPAVPLFCGRAGTQPSRRSAPRKPGTEMIESLRLAGAPSGRLDFKVLAKRK